MTSHLSWLSGLRHLMIAQRVRKRPRGDAAALVEALPGRQQVLITGATGFIGRRLVQALASAGHEVIVLTRDPAKAGMLQPPFRLITGLHQIADHTRIDAVIN